MFRSKARAFKKGIDTDESRRRRGEFALSLRKSKRDEQLQKRRITTENKDENSENRSSNGNQFPVELSALPQITQALHSNDVSLQLQAATAIRKLLSIENNPPITEVIQAGLVPRLVHFLGCFDNQSLQFESAWALTNVASGTAEQTQIVIKEGAIPIFIELLKSPHFDVKEQAVWAIGNIAGDSAECRDHVLSLGGMVGLLGVCDGEVPISLLRNATWAISNLCRGKPQPDFHKVAPAIPTLARLLLAEDEEVLTDACWAFSYLSDDNEPDNSKIQAVLDSGVVPRFLQLVSSDILKMTTPALRTLGNIVTGNDDQTQYVLNCGVCELMLKLLSHRKKNIRKETCWMLSNVTAGTRTQIQAVMEANLIPTLVHMLNTDVFDVQKEAAWALSNITSGGTNDHMVYLVSQGIIPPLCKLLQCSDPKIILVALEALDNLMRAGMQPTGDNKFADNVEECNGLDLLEQLQHHENEEIYDKAAHIIHTYFGAEDEEEDTLAPQVGENNQFAFGAQGNDDDQQAFQFNFQGFNAGVDTGFAR